MAAVTREQVEAVLKGVQDRYLQQDIVSLNQVKDINTDGAHDLE